jgi:hypothetical protein
MLVMLVCAAVALQIPPVGRSVFEEDSVGEPEHAELGLVAGGPS